LSKANNSNNKDSSSTFAGRDRCFTKVTSTDAIVSPQQDWIVAPAVKAAGALN
jgi:hypothetical protein